MGHWGTFDKERISGLVKRLGLPTQGNALDFGCGRGIFTRVISEALPGWKIWGCDISKEAVEVAKKNNPDITFFVIGDPAFSKLNFDFIHSHHVLEHTFDVSASAGEITSFAAEKCIMLHSLPCNHEGSLEHRLANWTRNGFDPLTGKFFFEDTAHLRRMNVQQAEQLFSKYNFRLTKKYFSNQYWGAVKWIAESDFKFVLKISNPFHSNSFASFFKLAIWRKRLVWAWFSYFTASAFSPGDRGGNYFLKKIIQSFCIILFFWFAFPLSWFISRKAKKEWEEKNEDPGGSDMFLVFEK
jgi:SAM-dependent methyltransferase